MSVWVITGLPTQGSPFDSYLAPVSINACRPYAEALQIVSVSFQFFGWKKGLSAILIFPPSTPLKVLVVPLIELPPYRSVLLGRFG